MARAQKVAYQCPSQPIQTRAFSRLSASSRRTALQPATPIRHCQNASSSFASHSQLRPFSETSRNAYKTVQEARSRQRSGPFSWKAAVLFVVTGAAMIVYFQEEKARLERKRIADETKGVGKPKVGGPFNLIDQDGKPFSSEDMKGKYALVYFGFTHCPDICPEELDKMAGMIDIVKKNTGNTLLPVFVTADPARDTPAVVKEYLKEFHPDFIGLTGSYDDIKRMCKVYRVYFSTPPEVKSGQDYLVDHSIYFYLMDPDGDFVEVYGRTHTAEEAAKIMTDHIKDWEKPINQGLLSEARTKAVIPEGDPHDPIVS
ncbi:mitochondrial metallochaperone Sco1 [Aulographum hederae CBS 113979]|uniref:Mitochondrial metallochaperone Sco1 n=1 Tax=Aulographum hederae CBS 113979 TaxID=1176131 RepID=A0A6G1HHA1_9PEZI|nr:mitochondrial metallochaperone Sco1 [Aulographum hederae CBS 113979]